MKKRAKRIVSLLLLCATVLASVCALSSCNLSSLLPASPSVGISKTEINEKGELVITYSNGEKDNLGVVVGKDGEAGAPGMDAGVRVISADINALGELILTYSDGTEENLGVVVGKDGVDATEPPTIQDIEVNIEISGDAAGLAETVAAAIPSAVCVYSTTVEGSYTSNNIASGVFYRLDKTTGDAIVITNYHAVYNTYLGRVADAFGITIYGSPLSSQLIEATFVGGSMIEDIAVLKVTGSERLRTSVAKAAVIGSSDALRPGDVAIAIGNPRGAGISATCGTVNVPSETMASVTCDGRREISLRVIRMDTAVNKGNSGGGVFDAEGRLIGIVNAKCIEQDIENIGYALPIDRVSALVENILYFCKDGASVHPARPSLGVTAQAVDSYAVLNTETGLYDIKKVYEVIEIDEGALGESIFAVGDRFISVTVDGIETEITALYHAEEAMLRIRPDKEFSFKVLREGVELVLPITIPAEAFIPF